MKSIEVELRSFITKKQYQQLKKYFNKQGKFIGEEKQITYYLSGKHDLRIQQSNKYSKIWLKAGKLHEKSRKEIEIKFAKDNFKLLYNLFWQLGYKKEIEWRRVRKIYKWDGVDVMLDYSCGYGYIIEMEIMSDKKNKDQALKILTQKFNELKIIITPKQEFDKKYIYYKNNWQRLLKQKNV